MVPSFLYGKILKLVELVGVVARRLQGSCARSGSQLFLYTVCYVRCLCEFGDIDEDYGVGKASPGSFPPPSLCRCGSFREGGYHHPVNLLKGESLGGEKNATFTSTSTDATGDPISWEKRFKNKWQRKIKHSLYHFTFWPDARIVSYQLTKSPLRIQFCIYKKKTVEFVIPFQVDEHDSSWEGPWNLMCHQLYLVLSRDNHCNGLLHYQFEKWPLTHMIGGESEGQLTSSSLRNQNTSQVLLLLILNTNFILITLLVAAEQCESRCEMSISAFKKKEPWHIHL